jgi:hypothetical protein
MLMNPEIAVLIFQKKSRRLKFCNLFVKGNIKNMCPKQKPILSFLQSINY